MQWRVVVIAIACLCAGIVVSQLATDAGWFSSDPPQSPSKEWGDSDVPEPRSKEWGDFPNTPKVELLDDGRMLRLLEDFVYIDPQKQIWVAPKDTIVDGASIPWVFWSITGGPLEGKFRNASIVHDEACKRRTKPWEDVHLMFYEACRCGGVPENKAKILYAAVYHFGPRWVVRVAEFEKMVVEPDGEQRTVRLKKIVPKALYAGESEPDVDIREQLEQYVNEHNPSLEELRKINPRDL